VVCFHFDAWFPGLFASLSHPWLFFLPAPAGIISGGSHFVAKSLAAQKAQNQLTAKLQMVMIYPGNNGCSGIILPDGVFYVTFRRGQASLLNKPGANQI